MSLAVVGIWLLLALAMVLFLWRSKKSSARKMDS